MRMRNGEWGTGNLENVESLKAGIFKTVACVASVPFRQKELRNDFPQTGRAEVGARD